MILALSLALLAPPAPAPARPKLVVVITVDQLRPDYFDRWKNQLTGGLFQLLSEGAVFADQAIMQKQAPDRRVKIISDRIAVQIDYKDAATCDSAHLPQEIDYPFISKMMSEQRADRIIELAVREWQPKCITTNRTNLRKLRRFFKNCRRRAFVQLEADERRAAISFPRPLRRDPKQFTRSRTYIEN